MNTKKQLMTVVEAAFALRVNPAWLRRQAKNGLVPCIDAGGTLMVDLEAVRAALAERAANGDKGGSHA